MTRAATTPMYDNLKLSLGTLTAPPLPDPTSSELSMVPLVEPIRTLSAAPLEWPANIFGETPHTAMADEITALYQAAGGADYVTAHTVVGESGKAMTALEKGATDDGTEGRAYAASMFEVQAIDNLATAAGKTYGVGAVVITHGEADAGNTDYEDDALPDAAGLHRRRPGDHRPDRAGAAARLAAELGPPADWVGLGLDARPVEGRRRSSGPVVCTGPKYQYPYFSDGVHLTTRRVRAAGREVRRGLPPRASSSATAGSRCSR